MRDMFNRQDVIPTEFDDDLIDFACDYSFRARFISGLAIPIVFILLDYFLVLDLPITVLVAVGIFEAFINQPYRFILKRVNDKSKILLANIIIDIVVIAIVVYYSGGITIPFVGFVFLITIVFNGIMAGITWALLFALLSSLFVFILASLEIYTDTIPQTGLRMEAAGLQVWIIAIGYTVFFVLFAILVHLPAKKFKNEIYQRYKANKILAESERRYRELFEESKDTVYISDPSGTFIDINPAGIELFGFQNKKEALAVHIASQTYVDPGMRDRWKEIIEEHGYVKDYEVAIKRMDGEQRIVLETATTVRNEDGKTIAYRGIMRDITTQKRLEEHLIQSQKLESLGYLAGGIAHDFNNILTIIQGSFSILKKRVGDSVMQSYVELGEKSIERGTDIVRRLLKFARVEEVNLRPVSIVEIADELVKVLEHSFEKTIELKTMFSPDIPQIEGDRGQLYQMLLNLFINARDAIHERSGTGGKGTVSIAIDTIDTDAARDHIAGAVNRSYVRITISDTGIGMRKKVQQHVFDPFFTTKPIGKGTGIGLSVVYGVVKSHNGFIDIDSEEDRGSTFTIGFPAINSKRVESGEPAVPYEESGTERILLVEDEDSLRTIVSDELQRCGYSVVTARDGKDAIDVYRSEGESIDCILLDIGLPKISGKDVLEHIRAGNPNVPVIIISGFVNTAQREELAHMGAQAVIEKPYKIELLKRKIREQFNAMK